MAFESLPQQEPAPKEMRPEDIALQQREIDELFKATYFAQYPIFPGETDASGNALGRELMYTLKNTAWHAVLKRAGLRSERLQDGDAIDDGEHPCCWALLQFEPIARRSGETTPVDFQLWKMRASARLDTQTPRRMDLRLILERIRCTEEDLDDLHTDATTVLRHELVEKQTVRLEMNCSPGFVHALNEERAFLIDQDRKKQEALRQLQVWLKDPSHLGRRTKMDEVTSFARIVFTAERDQEFQVVDAGENWLVTLYDSKGRPDFYHYSKQALEPRATSIVAKE